MDNNFSQVKRGALLAVRRQFPAGISLDGGTYWFFAARVQQRHRNGDLTVVFDELTGKQVAMRFDQQGYPIGPGDVAEHRDYEARGGLLVPTTPAIKRIFRHQKTLNAIWKLTWPDLLLLRNYELELIYTLLQEAKARSAARQLAAAEKCQGQRGDSLQPGAHNWVLCLKGDGIYLVEHFPYHSGDRVSVETRSVERDHTPYTALLVSFLPHDGSLSDEQLAYLRAFLPSATIFEMSEPLGALYHPPSLAGCAEG